MKVFSILVVVCLGLTTAQKVPANWGPVVETVANIGARVVVGAAIGALENLTGLKADNFNGILNFFRNANASSRADLLKALSDDFVAQFQNSPMLKGKSPAAIAKDYTSNVKALLEGLVRNPNPDYELTLQNEVQGLNAQEYQGIMGTQPENRNSNGGRSSSNVGSSRGRRQASNLPQSVDWRTKGAVTPVKNQGQCGSCWAFAAVGALEGRLGVKTGSAPVLSEQNLIDCVKNVNNTKCCDGCNGGTMTAGYSYVDINNGIASNASYPYEEKDGPSCRYATAVKAGESIGYEYTKQYDEQDLMRAVAEGPVAVAVAAQTWSSYKSGVLKCSSPLSKIPIFGGILSPKQKLNHGVTLVGYGSGPEGNYWIVKNSWGANWGEQGYLRIARNGQNECGIADDANYPLV